MLETKFMFIFTTKYKYLLFLILKRWIGGAGTPVTIDTSPSSLLSEQSGVLQLVSS